MSTRAVSERAVRRAPSHSRRTATAATYAFCGAPFEGSAGGTAGTPVAYQPVVKVRSCPERVLSASSALQNLEILPVFLRFCALI
jgi:hypothetical protein